MTDLVGPACCEEGSPLYNQYYTLHTPVRTEPGSVDQPITAPDLNRKVMSFGFLNLSILQN
jgi:hypothetical protein